MGIGRHGGAGGHVKFTLSISRQEVARIQAFFETHRRDPFVLDAAIFAAGGR